MAPVTGQPAAQTTSTGERTSSRPVESGAPTRRTTGAARSRRGRTTTQAELTTLQRDLLDECCQARVTRSAVTLAITLVDRGRLNQYGDPVGLVLTTLSDLNEMGLLTYRMSRGRPTAFERPSSRVPIQIRVTHDGYQRGGYLTLAAEVGRGRYGYADSADASVRHPGDRTDFRTHHSVAVYGEIERMPLPEHVARYPDHAQVHREQLEEMEMRPAATIDDTLVARIAHMKISGKTWVEIADEVGISRGTLSSPASRYGLAVRQVLDELIDSPASWRVADDIKREAKQAPGESLKEATYRLVQDNGPYDSVEAIAHDLAREGRRDDVHNLSHVLHSLRKQGRVTFSGRGDKGGAYRAIAVRGPRFNGNSHPEPEAPTETPPAPTVEASDDYADWPVLSALRARQAESVETRRRADAYLEAAAMLESVDPEQAQTLSDKASQLADSVRLSPIEAEYLAFADVVKEL